MCDHWSRNISNIVHFIGVFININHLTILNII